MAEIPPHPDDDPEWSKDELRIARYLREPTAWHEITHGGINEHNRRRYDFMVDQLESADGKTLRPGATHGTMVNRARESIDRGGQARVLIFDLRNAEVPLPEAARACRRIAGMYGQSGVHGYKLDRLIVIGDSYLLEEVL